MYDSSTSPKPNSAAQRTRQKIRTAFAELIQERKSLTNLHVSDVVRRADITRSTFYRHYDNLRQVAQDFQTEIIQAFFANETRPLHPEDINAYFDRLTRFLDDHAELYRMLLASDDSLIFLEQLSHRLSHHLYHALKTHDDPALWLDVNFFVGGVTALLLKFFRGQLHLSLDALNHYIQRQFRQTFHQHSTTFSAARAKQHTDGLYPPDRLSPQ